jgi:hypothetical protein
LQQQWQLSDLMIEQQSRRKKKSNHRFAKRSWTTGLFGVRQLPVTPEPVLTEELEVALGTLQDPPAFDDLRPLAVTHRTRFHIDLAAHASRLIA